MLVERRALNYSVSTKKKKGRTQISSPVFMVLKNNYQEGFYEKVFGLVHVPILVLYVSKTKKQHMKYRNIKNSRKLSNKTDCFFNKIFGLSLIYAPLVVKRKLSMYLHRNLITYRQFTIFRTKHNQT